MRAAPPDPPPAASAPPMFISHVLALKPWPGATAQGGYAWRAAGEALAGSGGAAATWRPVSAVEVLGVVVDCRNNKGRFLTFAIDDGSGCMPCILWLTRVSGCVQPVQAHVGSKVAVGVVARVCGHVTEFRGARQLSVDFLQVETDPDAEAEHWLRCIQHSLKPSSPSRGSC